MFSPERTVYTNEDIESPNEYQGGSYLGRYLEKNDSCIDNTNGQNIRVMMRLNSLEVKDDDDSNLKDRLDNDKSIDDDEKSNDDMEDTAHDDPNHENEKTKLDTQRVILLRMLLILTLVASATIVSLTVHSYISKNETNQFHNKFRNDAEKISEAVSGSLERTLGVLNAISIAFVSHAAQAADMNNDNITWPFVTLPDFALYASKFLPLTDGVYISVQPLVYPSQKVEWEEYASKNDQWVNDTMSIQEVWEGYHGNVTYDWTTNKHIYGTLGDVESNVSRYMLPQWQGFPIALEDGTFPYNFDWNSELYPEAVQTCVEQQHVILSAPYMIPYLDDEQGNAEMLAWSTFFSSYLPPNDEPFEPMLDIYYPIVNDLSRNAVRQIGENISASVGMLAIPIYWRSFLRDVLTEGSNGIIVVVHNTCNRPFTYQINGSRVVYLGVGDHHDGKYDGLVVTSNVVDKKKFDLSESGYSGAPIHEKLCPYTMHIYPSDTMKATFVSKDANIFASTVFLVFCFTSSVFILYDRYVERRQQRVKIDAMHASAIVSSLFPASVRERLFQSAATSTHSQNSSEPATSASTSNPIIGSPIAQEYPDTTVIFADIVGFTAWSSSRDPIQVFHLLETLYAGFDALANRYGVFKIETIGDCYVAVVGLPKPRKNHAVVMVKFANAIRTTMIESTTELEKTLGPGTADLALRVGLNSGPTTAGVLRGEKARFQLFGDTVNTAARMESNGAPFKIHVSESTAELLRSAGKVDWLEARKERIVAKGKGMMQTYWCEPSVRSSSVDEPSTNDLDSCCGDDDSNTVQSVLHL